MTKAIEFLEKLQKEAYSYLRETPEEYNALYQKQFDELYDEILPKYGITNSEEITRVKEEIKKEKQEREKVKLPTKYESVGNYSLILDFAELIENAIPALGFLDKKNGRNYTLKDLNMNITRPLFGTLPVGSLNATSYGFSNNEYLIIFEAELLQFCNLIAKIVAKAIPFNKEKGEIVFQFEEELIVDRIEKNDEILNRFRDLVIGFLLTGRATSASPYILEAPFSRIADHLRLAMEVFCMGHEYSHILLSHLDSNETKRQNLDSNEVFNVSYSWQQELDADGLGLPLMIIALQNQGHQYTDLSYCGADLLFSSYEIIARGKCILKNGTDECYWRDGKKDGPIGTHPPAHLRRENLRKSMEHQFGSKFLTRSYLVEKIIKILWDKTKPGLIKNRKELYKRFLSNQVKIHFLQKKYADALDYIEKILEIDKNYLPALFGKGNLFHHLGRFEDALQCYDLILKIEKDNVAALVQKARISFSKDEFEKCLEISNYALEKDKQNVYALYEKGMALDHLDRFKEAIECFNSILKLDKNNIPTLLRIAFAYSMLMKQETAIIYYDKVLKIDSYHPDAITQKLMLLDYLKKYDEALKMIDKFLQETPNDVDLLEIKKEIEIEKSKL